VFVDIDKARVALYVDLALRVLAPGGLLIVDNVLWHGWVLDPSRTDPDTDGMRRFNDRIAADPRVEVVMLPIADGIMLIRRRD
jgi:O-methyltransferase